MPTILNQSQAQLLRDEKAYLTDLHTTLAELKAPAADLDHLRDVLVQLDELFLIVVVGEFNAGKSALLNALLGANVLAEGVTPTTSRVTLIQYGDEVRETVGADELAHLTFPVEFLRELNIVDTPGTNAVIRRHEQLTREFIPRSDLVLFVTSADHPFTESERQFMEHIQRWGKKIVVVINKRDILPDPPARDQVRAFVEENAKQLLGFVPEIFFVSAKKDVQDGRLTDGMAQLQQYVLSWLDEKSRLKVKFASPLGVAGEIIQRTTTAWQAEGEKLAEDMQTAETVEGEIQVYSQEIQRELDPRLAELDNLLLRLEARGLDFFDRNIRIVKIIDLARGDRFRQMFEREVLAGVPEEIDNRTRAAVEWLVEKDMRHWQQVLSYLQRRRLGTADQMVGELTTSVDIRRRALLNTTAEAAQGVIASYDAERESREIGSHVESAVAQTAIVEAGAVGLGAVITTAFSVAAVDVTGILLAGVIAVVGFFIIPYKRTQAKERFKDKIEDLRTRLMKVLTTQFENEAERALTRLKEGVAPYLRFVRAERERMDRAETQLKTAHEGLDTLRTRVDKEFA